MFSIAKTLQVWSNGALTTFHVETTYSATLPRYHYWRSITNSWTRTPLPLPSVLPSINNITGTPTVIGKRGKLVAPSSQPDTLFAILPSNAANSTGLSIISSTAQGHFSDWKVIWETTAGCGWEPLFDRYRLEEDGVLSLYLINGTEVQVADFSFD